MYHIYIKFKIKFSVEESLLSYSVKLRPMIRVTANIKFSSKLDNYSMPIL
jgi:hypothetical protein